MHLRDLSLPAAPAEITRQRGEGDKEQEETEAHAVDDVVLDAGLHSLALIKSRKVLEDISAVIAEHNREDSRHEHEEEVGLGRN